MLSEQLKKNIDGNISLFTGPFCTPDLHVLFFDWLLFLVICIFLVFLLVLDQKLFLIIKVGHLCL